MKIYNGIEIDRSSKEWKELKAFFPETKWRELALRIETGFEGIFKAEGEELDESVWLRPVSEIVSDMGWNVPAFCVKIFGRWTKGLEIAFGNLYFRGTENCSNCGACIEDLYDHDENGDPLGKCKNCGGVQLIEQDMPDYYDPRG
jgi:hypothetical protein